MNCRDVQGLISPFIDNKLNEEELRNFIEHINSCSLCKEELDVYYTLLNGCEQLNEDLDVPANFHQDLMSKLAEYDNQVKRKRKKKINFRIATSVAAILVLVVSFGVLNRVGYNNKDSAESVKESQQLNIASDTAKPENQIVYGEETELKSRSITSEEPKMEIAGNYSYDAQESTKADAKESSYAEAKPSNDDVKMKYSQGVSEDISQNNSVQMTSEQIAAEEETNSNSSIYVYIGIFAFAIAIITTVSIYILRRKKKL